MKKYWLIWLWIALWSIGSIWAEKRALVVGVGNYDTDKTGWSKVHGDSDVEIIVNALLSNGFKSVNIKSLKNEQATKSAIVSSLKKLASECKPGDQVFFHFSGHGQPVIDLNGDEEDGNDESIIPYDACRTTRYKIGNSFYQGEFHLIDDQLNPLLDEIKKKLGNSGRIFAVMDACYSQGLEMDENSCFTAEDLATMGPIRGTSDRFKANPKGYLKNIARPKDFTKGARLTIVSACRENERNFEYKVPRTRQIYGSLSYCIAGLLTDGKNFSDMEEYFVERRYEKNRIFSPFQHPTVRHYE